MMYCTSCGRRIADDAALCPYCGMSVPQGDTLAEPVAAAGEGAAGAAVAGEAAAVGVLGRGGGV